MKPSTLLVVDDHPIIRRVVGRAVALVNASAVVAEATNVAEALRILQQVQIRAVITDYRLPDGTGREVLEAALRQNARMPVLVVSGSLEIEASMLSAGAGAFLAKPVEFEALLQWLRQVI